MKSGKTLVQKEVKDWKIEYNGEGLTSLNIVYEHNTSDIDRYLVVGSICLSQIECIERVR
jgi:hypothetical protein